MLSKEKVVNAFRGTIVGREIIYFDSTASTNDTAFEIARGRENPGGLVIVADSQTRGRGRMGRRWISPPGVNLYFTVVLNSPFSPEESSIFVIASAVAAAEAIRKYAGLNATIKWPNDIMINGRKTGGILVEMKSGTTTENLVAIGFGLNVNMTINAVTQDIRPFTTSFMIESGCPIDRMNVFGGVLAEMENAYKFLLKGNKRALINDWLRLNSTIGNKIAVQTHDYVIRGIAHAVNEKGELLVRLASGEMKTVSAGDVTILK